MICARISEKELREEAPLLIKLGYGSFQTALKYYYDDRKHFYTAGADYGWKSDIYDFGRVVLSVGYKPIGKSISYEIVNRCELEIQKIHDSEIPEGEKRRTIELLFNDFLRYCIQYAE